jgi:hypothetical protein
MQLVYSCARCLWPEPIRLFEVTFDLQVGNRSSTIFEQIAAKKIQVKLWPKGGYLFAEAPGRVFRIFDRVSSLFLNQILKGSIRLAGFA